MHAEEIADYCLEQTGAGKISTHARAVCYVAMLYSPTADLRVQKKQIRQAFKDSKEYGSFFLIFVLPILISLVSNWLMKWLWSTPTTMRTIRTMRKQAYAELTGLSPGMTGRLTSISFQVE